MYNVVFSLSSSDVTCCCGPGVVVYTLSECITLCFLSRLVTCCVVVDLVLLCIH